MRLLMAFPRCFIYGWMADTARVYSVAKGLSSHGWETSLLTSKRDRSAPELEVVRNFPGKLVQSPFYVGPWPMFLDIRVVRRIWLLLAEILGAHSILSDPERGWPVRISHWKNIENDCGGRPDVVWGVSCGFLDGVVAARALASVFDCPYVLEFQDPCPPPENKLSDIEAEALRKGLNGCAAVITTTEGLAEHIEETYPSCAGKTHVLYLSYDDEEVRSYAAIKASVPDRKMRILHAGRLLGGDRRNCRSLVRGLAEAARIEPGCRTGLELKLLGCGGGIAEAVELAKELGVAENVVTQGMVAPDLALKEMSEADVLTVIKYADDLHNMQIPGKLFQCLPFDKPILGIMGDCEAADILRRSGLGVIAAHEDIRGIAEALLGLWRARGCLDREFCLDKDYVSRFSTSTMAAKANQVLLGVLG